MGLSFFSTRGILRRRLRNHLLFVAEDDALLLAEGKGARLKQQEIAECLWERGMFVPIIYIREISKFANLIFP